MGFSDERFMRLLVFFDLPVLTKPERRYAALFRRFLINDGYHMLQFSVYARVCKGEDTVDKHVRRLNAGLPPKGNVRVLQVTEQQYARMLLLLGKPQNEEKLGAEQLLLF
jgi:CRISPR-associated protein Cas2